MSQRKFKKGCVQYPFQTFGCAGGGVGLGMAADWAKAHPDQTALVLCVEFSSLGFRGDKVGGISWFINSCLFGDGVAACVIKGADVQSTNQPKHLSASILMQKQFTAPNSESAMFYTYDKSGYNFIVDPTIIKTVAGAVPKFAEELASESFGCKAKNLQHVAVHPGGTRIVQGVFGGLGLSGSKSEGHVFDALRVGGNRASVTVLDILARMWDDAAPGDMGVAIGMGVGFVIAGVSFRFNAPLAMDTTLPAEGEMAVRDLCLTRRCSRRLSRRTLIKQLVARSDPWRML